MSTKPESDASPASALTEWATQLGLDALATLKNREAAANFVASIPIGFARQHCILGLASTTNLSSNRRMELAFGREASLDVFDAVGRTLRCDVTPVLVPETEIHSAINFAYQERGGRSQEAVHDMDADTELHEAERISAEDLLDSSGRPPVIKLVNSILFDAIRARASDVHVQPREDELVVRQRIDGVLFDTLTIPKDFQEEVLSRIKVLGHMNIAEKRLPQDGRATVRLGDRVVDLRIASLPTSFGERVVVRFLDKGARLYTLRDLGMDSDTLVNFRQLIKRDHGLLLVTGPTGSGKSTTLYAALQEINSKDLNVLTLEDPIEYQLDGISQTQINEKKGMTFAKGLRNILRQDPDIIMVGEIRDHETAEMAIQSALTGHLVFSTLHTNDAASAVTRLLDLGIEPFLVSSSLIGVVAQRLVRRLCQQCGPLRGEPSSRCDGCHGTGFSGRIGIFEQIVVNETIEELIQDRANAGQIRDQAVQAGTRLLADDGWRRVDEGLTTREEVLRVASAPETRQ